VKSRLITLANAVAVFAALLAIWQLILWIFRVPPYMLPSPWAVARAVGTRFPSLCPSLFQVLGGFSGVILCRGEELCNDRRLRSSL